MTSEILAFISHNDQIKSSCEKRSEQVYGVPIVVVTRPGIGVGRMIAA
jgi:hypothetical protein